MPWPESAEFPASSRYGPSTFAERTTRMLSVFRIVSEGPQNAERIKV